MSSSKEDAYSPTSKRKPLYNSFDKEEGSPNSKRKILYNSSDHHIVDIGREQLPTKGVSMIPKKPHLTNSRGNMIITSLNPKSYKVMIDSAIEEVSSESEVKIKSDISLFYDSDGVYNIFELRIICQQIKCTGHLKTSKNTFDLILEDYKGIRCQDNLKNYIILSKHILKTKTIPLIRKSLSLSMKPEQTIYYPIFVICHQCEMSMCEFEVLFPYLMYNMITNDN